MGGGGPWEKGRTWSTTHLGEWWLSLSSSRAIQHHHDGRGKGDPLNEEPKVFMKMVGLSANAIQSDGWGAGDKGVSADALSGARASVERYSTSAASGAMAASTSVIAAGAAAVGSAADSGDQRLSVDALGRPARPSRL